MILIIGGGQVEILITASYGHKPGGIHPSRKQVDILISKNQALQILYLKHIKLHKLATMDRNPRKFNPHKRYCTVLLLYYNSRQNIPYNWPTGFQQVLNFICVI